MGRISKNSRILRLYDQLLREELVQKDQFIMENGIDERTFERDLDSVRAFLSDEQSIVQLHYDRSRACYCLSKADSPGLNDLELLVITKIIFGCHCFRLDELKGMRLSLLGNAAKESKRDLDIVIQGELGQYRGPHHDKAILKMLGDLKSCIFKRSVIDLSYCGVDQSPAIQRVLPVDLCFAEFYFYLIAYTDKKDLTIPTFFRVDRIASFSFADRIYEYAIQNMYHAVQSKARLQVVFSGEPQRVELIADAESLEAVLDRLPLSTVKAIPDGRYRIIAETFDSGFVLWVLSQGTHLVLVNPPQVQNAVIEKCHEILEMYQNREEF